MKKLLLATLLTAVSVPALAMDLNQVTPQNVNEFKCSDFVAVLESGNVNAKDASSLYQNAAFSLPSEYVHKFVNQTKTSGDAYALNVGIYADCVNTPNELFVDELRYQLDHPVD